LTNPTRALFLGAGASVDAGMPVVRELTAELARWLTPAKLSSFNRGWRARGGGWHDTTASTLIALLQNQELHYEQIIGAIEVEFARERDTRVRQEWHAVHGFLLQAARGFLLERQIKNLDFALSVLEDFGALKKLAEESRPLWVFTTNHDVIVEILAAKFAVPVKSGFTEKIALPMNAGDGRIIDIAFERLPRAAMAAGGYDFFKPGEIGINLIKLHGSLDIFGQGDELSYLKVASKDGGPRSYVEQLQCLEAIDFVLGSRQGVRTVNEHCYLDSQGKVQFLRNSLLSGAHKFSPRMSQIAPPEFLSLFRGFLNFASELICIGYGFGDHHINEPMADWLAQSAARQLIVVNPGITRSPDRLAHLCWQVRLVPKEAREYFLDVDERRRTDPARYFIRQLQTANRKRRMDELLGHSAARGT
jgi:hypothetical protein